MQEIFETNRIAHVPFHFGKITAENAAQFTLCLHVHKNTLLYSVLDNGVRPLAYGLVPLEGGDGQYTGIGDCFRQLPILSLTYKKVWLSYSAKHYVVLPEKIHNRAHNEHYLQASYGKLPGIDIEIRQDHLMAQGLILVYPFPTELEKQVLEVHSGASIRHEKSILIKALSEISQEHDKLMWINLAHEHFDLLIFKSQKMLFCNSFSTQNTDEMLYFIFDTCKQLGLDVQSFKPILSGLRPLNFHRQLSKKFLPEIREYAIPHCDIYHDSSLFIIPHYLNK